MKKKRITAMLVSAVTLMSAISQLSANASTPDDFQEKDFSDCIRVDDYAWLTNGYNQYEAVYMRLNDDSSATSYNVSFQPDIIYFTVSADTDCKELGKRLSRIDEGLILEGGDSIVNGGYYLHITRRTADGRYDKISSGMARVLFETLSDIAKEFDYTYDRYGYTYSVYSYITAYEEFGYGFSVEETLNEYVKDNNINAEIIRYSDGDTDIRGNEVSYDMVYVIPTAEFTSTEHYVLAKNIAEITGISPYGITPTGLDDTVISGKTVDIANSVDGDANCDGRTNISDAVAILQNIANAEKYPLSEQGKFNADTDCDGISGVDALRIQMKDAGII